MTSEERISRLEGTYEQVDGRLGDLTLSFEALRTEMMRANEALRAEMTAASTTCTCYWAERGSP